MKRLPIVVFFALYLIIGLVVYRDYGVSWDEHISRENGKLSYFYITTGDRQLLTHVERYHGSAFELPLYFIETIFPNRSPQQIFAQRHVLTFLYFYLGAIAFFHIIKIVFKSSTLGIIGSIFLIVNPRIFADSFYNSKDAIFFAAIILAFWGIVQYFAKPTLRRAVIMGILAAYATDIRLLGIFLLPLIAALSGFVWLNKRNEKFGRMLALNVGVFLASYGACVVIFWPVLWDNPLFHFFEAFRQMQQFPWQGSTKYLGVFVKATELPWHYLPVWIVVTTPIAYLLLFSTGLVRLVYSVCTHPRRFIRTDYLKVLFVGWVFVPMVYVFLFRPVLYDGWRHMYFIYPGMVGLSLMGLQWLWGHRRLRYVSGVLVVVSMLQVVYFIVRYHPHQYVYFNQLVGSMQRAKELFEMDYWGLSYRKGLEFIAATDSRPMIRVFAPNSPRGLTNSVSDEARAKLTQITDIREADYFITTYRGFTGSDETEPYTPVYEIRVGNARILAVYAIGGR